MRNPILTPEKQIRIKQLHSEGIRCYQISRMVNISDSMVRNYLVREKLINPKKRKPAEIREYKLLTESDMEFEMETIIYK